MIVVKRIPLSMQVLLALLLGVIAAATLPKPGASDSFDNVVMLFGTLGQLWVAALQMTILPLVFSLLANGLGGAKSSGREGGQIARRSVLVFAALYGVGICFAIGANLLLLKVWPVSDEVKSAFAAVAGGAVSAEVPKTTDVILSIIPSNLFAALAAGAILPVVTFAIVFGLAMRQITPARREGLSETIAAIAEVMFKILSWVLLFAPLGVFGLILATAHSTGTAVLSAMGSYIRHVVTVSIIMILLSYLVAWLWGRRSPFQFARAVAPSQLVAMSTRSSVASLPVMLRSAKTLDVPEHVSSVALPLAVALFRFGGPASTFSIATFAASAAGIELSLMLVLTAAALSILMEFATVGLANQVNFMAVISPVFAALGAPLGVLPLMLAVDPIPDAFGTVSNVSMDVAATTAVARRRRSRNTRPIVAASPRD